MLAISVGAKTPDGFLGVVRHVTHKAGETLVQTAPTTLRAALPEGSFELANAKRVTTAKEARARSHLAPTAKAASGSDSGLFNEDLSKAISCRGGATFAAKGSVGLASTPKLSFSWGFFSGVSASFTETVTASASLSGEVSAAGNCEFARTGLLAEPADLGTFVGDVLGIPVVVTISGQIYLEGKADATGSVKAGVSGQASASGGVSYSEGEASIISPSANLQFSAQGPTVNVSASVGAHLTPELQMLLYGVAGPVFDATTGLDLSANTASNPWWTLTSPLEVAASLQAPVLELSTGALTLYSHTFTIAQAPGPFGATTTPSSPTAPTPPPPPPSETPTSTPTLIDDASTAIPPEGESFEFIGDRSFNEWAQATGQPADVQEGLPANISRYQCVVLLTNETLQENEKAELANYLSQGGTVLAIGEHSGEPYTEANKTLSHFAEYVGAGLSLNNTSDDEGPNVTYNISPSPLTKGVTSLGDNWVSTIHVTGTAEPLAETADSNGTLIGAQTIGKGTFVMTGDSNLFTDDNQGFYNNDNNEQLVRNLCP